MNIRRMIIYIKIRAMKKLFENLIKKYFIFSLYLFLMKVELYLEYVSV